MSPSRPRPENHVIVLFGATGDLAKRKLLPGLFNLHCAGLMPEEYRVIGVVPTVERALRRGVPAARTRCRRGARHEGALREDWEAFVERLSFAPADARQACGSRTRRGGGGAGDRWRRHARLPPRDPAAGVPGRREDAGRHGPRRARTSHRREAVRHRPRVRPGAQRVRARRVRRGRRLPDRPLPGQGVDREHPRPAFRERAVRAHLEPRAHRARTDRRARDPVGRGSRRLLREHRRVSRHGRHAPLPGARLRRDGAADVAHRESLRDEKAKVFDGRCSRSTRRASCAASTGLPRRGGRRPRLRHGDVRRARGRVRQLALGGRAVLPAHRQGAGRGPSGDHDRLPRAAAADVPLDRRGRARRAPTSS